MGFFNLFGSTGNNINELVEQARTTREALIIDVRTPAEFSQGHIEGATNIPLDNIQEIASKNLRSFYTAVSILCKWRSKL